MADTPDPAATIIALEAELEGFWEQRTSYAGDYTTAVVRNAQVPDADRAAEVGRLADIMRQLDGQIAGHVEAISRVREVQPELERQELASRSAACLAQAKQNATDARKAARAVDDALDVACDAFIALREATAKLLNEADAGVREVDGFEMLAYFVNTLPRVVNDRLAHSSILPANNPLLDRAGARPSVRAHLDRAIYGLVPPQGRPRRSDGGQDVAA